MDNHNLCSLILDIYHCHVANKPYDNQIESLTYGLDHIRQLKAYLGSGYLPYYEQALTKTMEDVQKNITKFFTVKAQVNFGERRADNPEDVTVISKAFISWVMVILKRDCQDERRRIKRCQASGKGVQSLDTPIAEGLTLQDVIPAGTNPMDNLIDAETARENKRKHDELLALLPEKLTCRSKKYPQCHCYDIFVRQYLQEPKQTFKEIAQELGMAQGTITGHWYRKCQPILDELAHQYR
ncbi:hypothetical protein AWQ21_14725 (plasmid) [Picosynechococcus sp. PCC 7003]|uniref:RNA polymerase sigma factor n=1 Tax=Picosynechococcus sp. PCC 7003 TaxID=374981 RepID=UPI00081041B2|nr:sigma-70 family RNA polymerase sigma factor [Picosynechococcus sp. PCC 7003]ANV85785.1 hypothetical protein AWQ21_14725 [Picosynechococcus sp. PCC 7003]